MAPFPSGWGAVKWCASADAPPPTTSQYIFAPRALACSYSSKISAHRRESSHARFVDRSLRTARDHHVGLAPADLVEGVDHAVVRRSAGRNDTVVGAHESVLHRDEAGRDVGDHAGNEERAKPRGVSSLGIARTFVEERFESSDTRTPNDARLLLVKLLHVEPCVLHGLRGGDEGVLGEEVVLAYLLAVEILGRVVILYFTSEFRFEFLRVEVRDGGGSADTFLDILDRVADRRDLLCVLVGDLNIESLLELHDELYGVERIRTEVVGEACFGYDFRLFDSQLVYDDLDDFLLNF